MAAVSERVRDALVTPAGNLLFVTVRDLPPAARGPRMRIEANRLGIRPCAVADTYDALAAEAEYRSVMQALCSYVTFPGLGDLEEARRVEVLDAWLAEAPPLHRLQQLRGSLHEVRSGADAAALLRSAASEIGILTCDTAKTIAVPLACLP